jgi:DNA-binding PadR family transcriptional regulator
VLHRLESKGILAPREEEIGGRLRRYYRLSQPGKKRLAQLMDELQTVNRTVEIIGGLSHAL